uniref:Uncharacterized protein n=1 Tax=Ditylenchus dipsaci TaxID=166011 RepID=A0A915DUV9_9BILA
MPVEIAPLHELQPFFDLLREGKGINQQFLSAQKRSCIEKDRDQLAKEFISMPKGTLFADGRMDMCKQVVGSQNLQALFGSEGAKALGHCLAGPDCPLRLLDLNNCGLGNQGLDAFCHAVELTGTEILALRYVYLDANAIAGGSPAFSRLCQLLKGPLRGMRTFYLSINSLGDHGVMELVKVLPDMKNLRYLSLASNQITDRVMPELLKSFPNSLKGLDLGYYKSTKDLGGLPTRSRSNLCHFLSNGSVKSQTLSIWT